jgi:Flp pilus assembly protein TadG
MLSKMVSKGLKCRSEKGQAVVEFTFVALFFFMLIFAIVEFSHLFYTRLTLQHALSEAGRFMITGQGIDISGKDPNARLTIIKNKFCEKLIGTGLSCADLDSHLSVDCPGGCTQPAGGAGQTVTVSVRFEKHWFTALFNNISGGPVSLTVSTTWKNEPYLSS